MKICILGHESRNVIITTTAQAGLQNTRREENPKEKETLMVYLKRQNGDPYNGAPSSPFIAQGGKAVIKGETKIFPSIQWGIFAQI